MRLTWTGAVQPAPLGPTHSARGLPSQNWLPRATAPRSARELRSLALRPASRPQALARRTPGRSTASSALRSACAVALPRAPRAPQPSATRPAVGCLRSRPKSGQALSGGVGSARHSRARSRCAVSRPPRGQLAAGPSRLARCVLAGLSACAGSPPRWPAWRCGRRRARPTAPSRCSCRAGSGRAAAAVPSAARSSASPSIWAAIWAATVAATCPSTRRRSTTAPASGLASGRRIRPWPRAWTARCTARHSPHCRRSWSRYRSGPSRGRGWTAPCAGLRCQTPGPRRRHPRR